jgi:hypothetical protein
MAAKAELQIEFGSVFNTVHHEIIPKITIFYILTAEPSVSFTVLLVHKYAIQGQYTTAYIPHRRALAHAAS